MIPLQTIRGAVICFDAVPEKDQHSVEDTLQIVQPSDKTPHPLRATHTVFTAVVSAWRKGMCLASEEIHGCCEEDVDDFWRDRFGLKKEGPFFDAMQLVLSLAEEQGMISKERQEGYKPFELLAEFIYLDERGYLRWCPRSEAMRKDANYFRYEKFDEFVNRNFAHAIVAAPEFTFMGETYQYQELHDFLKEKRRKHRENSTRNSGPTERTAIGPESSRSV